MSTPLELDGMVNLVEDDDTPVSFIPWFLRAVKPFGTGTRVVCAGKDCWDVQETPGQVWAAVQAVNAPPEEAPGP